jgi:hypothetical protein
MGEWISMYAYVKRWNKENGGKLNIKMGKSITDFYG